MEEAHADADFYINDGRSQPGCDFNRNADGSLNKKLGASCEHERVNQIWTSSLAGERCQACPCKERLYLHHITIWLNLVGN